MADSTITDIINRTLEDLLRRFDDLNLDEIDTERGDGKLVVELESGVKLIVSRQSAADQIWLAEPNGGWHYDYRDGAWIDAKRGVELIASLEALLTQHLGRLIRLES